MNYIRFKQEGGMEWFFYQNLGFDVSCEFFYLYFVIFYQNVLSFEVIDIETNDIATDAGIAPTTTEAEVQI